MKSYILRLFAALVVSLGLVTLASVAACGSSSASTTGTVVLVHGAWADGSSWSSVTRVLQARGLKVVTVQLPRTSLADDAATVTRAIDAQQGPVLLVDIPTEAPSLRKPAALTRLQVSFMCQHSRPQTISRSRI